MVVRFTYLKFPPDNIAGVIDIYKNETAPAIKTFKGNKEAMLLEPDDELEDYISFTLWEDAQSLSAFESSEDYKKIMGRIKEVVLGAVPKYYHVKD